jgi:DNA-binding beta-propeller fold protein YncE
MRLRSAALLFFGAMASAAPAAIEIPGGSAGVGFDDLRFSVSLGKILVPAGRTGSLVLLDPATRNLTAVEGFSAKKEYGGGHDDGVTSADSGKGWVFATDRTSGLLVIIDPAGRHILSRSKLGGSPDYVRYVEPSGEVWVTEPDSERIEIFRLLAGIPPVAVHDGFLSVPGGPESLAVDARGGRAYTHLWNGKTVAIDVKRRRIAATWNNGCKGSRGLALDEARGFLFAACSEGKAVVLDVATGKELSSARSGSGVDVIDYDAKLSHLYLPGARSATMAVLGVSPAGKLSLLGTKPTAPGAHCVVSDGNGNVFVCDPKKGRLLVFSDSFR